MRRLLILFVVIAIGTGLLWHFEQERRAESERQNEGRSMSSPASDASSEGSFVERPRDGSATATPASNDHGNGPSDAAGSDAADSGSAQDGSTGDEEEAGFKRYSGEQATVRGKQEYSRRPRTGGEPHVFSVAEDVAPLNDLGTLWELQRLTVTSTDPDSDKDDESALRSRIQAKTANIAITQDSLGIRSFADQTEIQLYGVLVEQFKGTPFAPMTIESARLDVDLGTEQLESPGDDVVEFRSRDLRGTGVGLDAKLRDGVLAFERNADVTIEVGHGRVARLTTPADGPLVVEDISPVKEEGDTNGPRDVRVTAERGVHVELRARDAEEDESSFDLGDPIFVDADSMTLDMRTSDATERPELQSAFLGGNVKIRHGRDTYRGDSARIHFEDGQPSRIVIEEAPVLMYTLAAEDGTELKLRLTGDGPVTGYLDTSDSVGARQPSDDAVEDERVRFVFVGPGRIEAVDRGGVLTFENEARGQGLWDQDEGTVLVSGGVRVESLEGSLSSESVLVTYHTSQDLRFACEGPTRVVGRALEGAQGQYHVRADGGLVAHLTDERWYVDRAEGVYAESFGEEPYRVEAGTLTDVDIEARTFTANGDIDYESLWGKAFAAVAVVRGTNSVKLVGTEQQPVTIDLVPEGERLLEQSVEIAGVRTGWIRAVALELTQQMVLGTGGVTAQFETLEGVWGFDSEELDARRTPIGDGLVGRGGDDGPVEVAPGVVQATAGETLHVEARFVREARFDTDRGNVVFRAERVEVDATANETLAEPGAPKPVVTAMDPDRPATLRASGEVVARIEVYEDAIERPTAADLPADSADLAEASATFGPAVVAQSWDLESDSATLERTAPEGDGADASAKPKEGVSPFNLVATNVRKCAYQGAGRMVEVTADEVEIDGQFDPVRANSTESDQESLLGSSLVARGSVDLMYREAPGQPMTRARGGETLILIDGTKGRLDAEKGKRVRVTGVLPGGGLPYTLNASNVTFSSTEVTASSPAEINLPEPIELSMVPGAQINRIRAESFYATEDKIEFRRNVKVFGPSDEPGGFKFEVKDRLTIDPQKLKRAIDSRKTIGPRTPVRPGAVWTTASQEDLDDTEEAQDEDLTGAVDAEGVFELVLGEWTLKGTDLLPMPDGSIGADDASIANLADGVSFDADRIEINLSTFLIQAGRGVIRGSRNGGWSLEFAAIESQSLGDEIMFVIVAPRIQFGDDAARADYLSFWVDAEQWRAHGRYMRGSGPKPPPPSSDDEAGRLRPNFLAELLFNLQDNEYASILRALYMEGEVEVSRADRRAATGSKLYIDLPKTIAWLQDAELVYPLNSRGTEVPLRIRTERLETDQDGRLVANGATLTTCDHDVPHFVVGTRKFSLEPRGDGRWRFGARGNRLRFQRGVVLPLPSIGNLVLDEDFGVEGFENEAGEVTPLRDIGIARTARFGTVLGAAFRFDVGSLGEWIGKRIGMDTAKVRGKWETEAQYLGSRGPLVGLGLKLREREPGDDPNEDFRLDAFVAGIPDDGEDRGTVRILDDERDDVRVWGYLRSRYPIVRGEWIDVAVASQSDAGVQPEFYENEFLRFEQRDTFVRWRKSYGADYLTGGARKRIDDFRSQAEELPSFSAYRGEREVGKFTGLPVLWGGSFDVGYYTRREADFDRDIFSDLPVNPTQRIGNRETGRADLLQRLAIPLSTELAGIKATPFAELRGTAWTTSLDNEDDPFRGAARAGAELSTTLHKVTQNGFLHALAPRVAVSTDLWYDDNGTPVPIDRTEDPIDGVQYEAGVRGLWQRPATFENLDIDVRTIFRQDRENGFEDTAQLATLAEWITRYGDGEGQVGVRHDGRYNLENSNTAYSQSALAIRPNDAFLVEFRYGQSRAINDVELFETGGILGRWRMDEKWELEATYVHDLQNDDQLFTEITLRRFSHDFVFDITVQDRAGEGGTNFSFNLAPLLGWTRSRLGMLDR